MNNMSKRLTIKTKFLKMLLVSSLVILFLLKLRFPKNDPISDVLRRRYGHPALHGFRRVEHAAKKLAKKECDLQFLQCCKIYEVIPKFLKFKLYRKSLHNSEYYKKWQKKLLDLEIRTKEKEVVHARSNVNRSKAFLKTLVSRLDLICLTKFINDKTEVYKKNVRKLHDRKLHKIGGKQSLSSCDPEKVVFNYSSVRLSYREKFLLSFGLDFGLPVHKLSFCKFFLNFETMLQRLKQFKVSQLHNFGDVVQCIQNIARYHFHGFKPYKVFSPIISREDIGLLKSLGKKKDLVICKPDKGRGVVLLDRADYTSKMNEILQDTSKFTKLIYSDIHKLARKIEDKVSRFINNLASLNVIDPIQSRSLKPSGSSPAILYGLPKIHKASIPLRPIMAAYNTATYKLSKFLVLEKVKCS